MDDPRLSGIQLQGNNFCTGLWLWSETGGLHLTCPSAVFLVSYKRLLILLRWKCLFTLIKHWSSPNRKGSRPPSYGRDTGTQVFRHGTRVPIPLVKNKIFTCRMLSWPPCCPACCTAEGCCLWSKTGKCVLTAQLLHFTVARVSRSYRELRAETAKDPGTHPLPPALLQQQRFGRGEDGQLRAAASLQQSYWSSAKRVLTYHYYWGCCCYYCYGYYMPLLIHPEKPNQVTLYSSHCLTTHKCLLS